MESSLCEKPERHASRRLSDHLTFEGQKKVHSLVDKVGQLCLTDPFSPDLAKPFMKARNVSTILRQSHFVFRLERLAGGLAD